MQPLSYTPLERVRIPRAVQRIPWIVGRCRGRAVLDLGCFDETASVKRATDDWLHGQLAAASDQVLGIDSSPELPDGGLVTGPRSRIVRGDAAALEVPAGTPVDVIVAGELIEHLPDALGFLRALRRRFPGRELIATTPNATSLTNALLAATGRESAHRDHLQIFSVKTLNTLCVKAGLESWDILPYHVYFTEMALRSRGAARRGVLLAQRAINIAEGLFPMLSGGLILHARRI